MEINHQTTPCMVVMKKRVFYWIMRSL